MYTDLPDLHPDAMGATVCGVHYTREEYEALRTRQQRPAAHDLDPIAVEILAAKILRLTIDNCHPQWNDHMRVIGEQLRQVWNARGAADVVKLEAELSEMIATRTTHERLAAAIRSLDR